MGGLVSHIIYAYLCSCGAKPAQRLIRTYCKRVARNPRKDNKRVARNPRKAIKAVGAAVVIAHARAIEIQKRYWKLVNEVWYWNLSGTGI